MTIILLLLILYTIIVNASFNCDCGYKDVNSTWNEMWYMNFSGNNQYLHNDLFVSNYEIAPKFNDAYARVFRKENVVVNNESLEIGVTIGNNNIQCGGIGTTRQDFLYGSFRSFIKSTNVKGTVAGMFIYHPQGEIDIEILSSLEPFQVYFAMHPGLIEKGRASHLTHGNYLFNFDPTLDYHEYRFDWYPDLTIFYIDGIEAYRISTNVLSQPSRVMFNHWTDGNINFSKGPVKENAFMNIKNMTFFFNSSSVTTPPKCINLANTCDIQEILGTLKDNPSTSTTIGEETSSSTNTIGEKTSSSTSSLYIETFIYLLLITILFV